MIRPILGARLPTVLLGLGALLIASACTAMPETSVDPESAKFYETARLVMTDAERDIFVHLPDQDARREFIKEFWDKRDPDPSTEENEFRTEFERRLEYVGKRFSEGGRGLNTDRGRIYLFLGEPEWTEEYPASPIAGQMENILVWYYYRYDLAVVFRSPMGMNTYTTSIEEIYGDLNGAIDMAKLGETYTGAGFPGNYLSFSLKYDKVKREFILSLPAKRINFKVVAGQLLAEFDLDFTIYKIGTAEKEKFSEHRTFQDAPEAVEKGKSITFTIPRDIPAGKYYVDVIVNGKEGIGKARKIFAVRT